MAHAPRPVIAGLSGPVLSAEDHRLLRRINPAGVILFRRNIVDPEQLGRLCRDVAESLRQEHPIILVDQEGGRVRRLAAPPWPAFPAAGNLAAHPAGLDAASTLQGRLMGQALRMGGISVNCAPVLDVRTLDSNDAVMGDRCFGMEVAPVIAGGMGYFTGQCAAGMVSVVKHMPGHGRARVDSHYDLPVIDTPLSVLSDHDFVPFRYFAELADVRLWGMTAHILLPEIDAHLPATLSPAVVDRVIRGMIGFSGLLLSDDLEMGALSGTIQERAQQSLKAGCDVFLHCSGKLGALAAGIENITPMPEKRWQMMLDSLAAARAGARPILSPTDYQQALDILMGQNHHAGDIIDPTLFQPLV